MRFIPPFLFLFLTSIAAESAEIRINGVPEDKKAELIAKVNPRLDFIKTREPSPWRADDAAYFFKRLLIRAGHVDAEVDWKLPGGNIIEINAKPGARYLYGVVRANQLGPLTKEELSGYFFQPLVETEIVLAKNAPYITGYSAQGATNVRNFLHSKGYWQASVSVVHETFDRNRKRVDVSLKLSPGPLFKLTRPSFRGLPIEDTQRILSQIQYLIGKQANTINIIKISSIVENYFNKRGFHYASIQMNAEHKSGKTQLIFNINRGQLFTVNKIIVKGQKKTKKQVIRRYFDGLKNQHFNQNAADTAQRDLLATGAFLSATLKPITSDGGMMDLEVNVVEAKAKSFRSYLGVGSYEGPILGLSYTNLNLKGRLLRFNARGEYSGRGILGEVSLTDPRFAGEALRLNTRAFLLQRRYEGYDKSEGGVETGLLVKYADHYSSRLYLGMTHASTSSSSLTSMELGPNDYTNTRVGFEQTVDFRDDPVLPTRGFYARGVFETGNVSGDASTNYHKITLDGSYRFSLSKNNTIMTRFSTGAIDAANENNLPIDLHLFSGGPDSVRSFNQRELGPSSISGDPLGGTAYWNASVEYIRTINDPIKGVIFFDMGQVYNDESDWLSFKDPSYALGLGLRIDLPIGPVRLEYGYNMNQRKGEPSGTLHFSIGTSF